MTIQWPNSRSKDYAKQRPITAVHVGAVTCSAMELSPCLPALLSPSPSPPSMQCCSKLREQKPCLCGYIKNPALARYFKSPNARNVAKSCGVPIPTC
ncbi:hypothetical protein MLD38_033814 [Melastoma candidum]|uniref:Uncharacterized protein n=1 Tax=Melastoma candidum TaxID=119954 RepID=A0ACB9M8F5_9MYRT|nr:hypothetical protein MLD38_033814 [Melastoma candidum]